MNDSTNRAQAPAGGATREDWAALLDVQRTCTVREYDGSEDWSPCGNVATHALEDGCRCDEHPCTGYGELPEAPAVRALAGLASGELVAVERRLEKFATWILSEYNDARKGDWDSQFCGWVHEAVQEYERDAVDAHEADEAPGCNYRGCERPATHEVSVGGGTARRCDDHGQ